MPRCDGLEATRRIKRERPGVVVIMLTVSDNDQDLFAAIKAGASGYLMKDLEPAQLFQLVEAAGRGEAALPGPIAARVLQEFRDHVTLEPPAAGLAELSERERDVLKLLAGGANNREIAEALSIAENTVKIHLRNILEKLHLNNRVHAAVYAARHRLGG